MLHTSNNIRNPGLRTLPPGVERYVVEGGGLTGIQILPDDEIEIIVDKKKKTIEIIAPNFQAVLLKLKLLFLIV